MPLCVKLNTVQYSTVQYSVPILNNLSLGMGIFPQKWKMAHIVPLQKSPDTDRLKPSLFCPVALLPIISKLTGRTVQQQLLHYLESSGQLHQNQHAYRDRCMTTTALIQIMDNIATVTDNNMVTTTISIDQCAAFDCVDHSILKEKLKFYGLDQKTTKWIDSYLIGRSSFVVVGSGSSTIKTQHYGVPKAQYWGH